MISAAVVCCFMIASIVAQDVSVDWLAESSADFSQRLYQQIALDKSNIVYSPFSVRTVLGLLQLGAAGETAREIDSVAFQDLNSFVHEGFKQLLLQWNMLREVRLYNGNGIFVNPSSPVERQFVDSAWNYYFAQSANIDLDNPEGPEKPINDYVERQTKGFIKDVLPIGTITNLTSVVLVNTIFLNATWERPFNPKYTRKGDFHTLDGRTIKVDMLDSIRVINLRKDIFGADVLELPYRDNFAFYVALPHRRDGITQLESDLSEPDAINELFTEFRSDYRILRLPKFKIESDVDLKKPLVAMGIRAAFSDDADLTGISELGGLSVSEVFHKAVFEVHEAGTVAAEATAVEAATRSQKVEFTVDHPFIFFIRDRQTNIVLFQGKYSG